MWGIAVIHHDFLHLIPRIVHVDEGISRHPYLIMLGEQTSVVCPDDVCGVASVECHADVIGSDRDGHKAVGIIVENGHLVVD